MSDTPPIHPPLGPGYWYDIAPDGRSIRCANCGRTSHNPNDAYFRYCGACETLLGPQVRQRWNTERDQLRELCQTLGRYKRVTGPDGKARRVPTEWIITQGIKGDALEFFPLWEDGDESRRPEGTCLRMS